MTDTNWLTKPRLSDEGWRAKAAFVGKGLAAIVGAVWVLCAGSDLIDKRAKVLSSQGMPVADTSWGGDVVLSRTDNGACVINGQYQLTNIGDLAIDVEKVVIELFLTEGPVAFSGDQPSDYSGSFKAVRNTIAATDPLISQEIIVNEVIGKSNRIDTGFVLSFELPEGTSRSDQFVLSARGTGGLLGVFARNEQESGNARREGAGSNFGVFELNDLRITSDEFSFASSNDCSLNTEQEGADPRKVEAGIIAEAPAAPAKLL